MSQLLYPRRFQNLVAARAQFGERVDRVGSFLWQSDELADRVVAWMMQAGPAGQAMLDRALDRGIDSVDDAPDALRALFAIVDRVPQWVDFPTLSRGGEVLLRAGILGGFVLGARSIIYGYTSPGGNKPLVFSGRLNETAARRLHETSRFVEAVCTREGMRRFSDGFKITVKVRIMHAMVRAMILRSGRWEMDEWGLPINQHDMAGTTLLFSVVLIDGLRQLGCNVSAADSDDYMHLWRYVGWLIGVDPELLPSNEAEGRRYGLVVKATQGAPDEDARKLTRALHDAPLTEAKTRLEKSRAWFIAQLGRGLTRGMMGDEIADQLGVERTPLDYVVPTLSSMVWPVEQLRRAGSLNPFFTAIGRRYWAEIIKAGLGRNPATFAAPDKLGNAARRHAS